MSAPDGEDLRRRLYRPDAAAADVEAYLAAHPEAPGSGEPDGSPDPGTPSDPRRRRRRAVVAASAGVVGLLVLLGVVRATGQGTAAAPTAAPAASVGARPRPAPAADPLPTAAVDESTRSALARDLLRDRDAGLGAWLDRRLGAPGLRRDRFVETHGSGDAVVILPGTAADGGGRLTVLLVLAEDGTAGWSTARLVIHDDRTIHLLTTSDHVGTLRAGVPAIGRLDFTAGTRPIRLLIAAPDDAEWGVAALTSS